MRVLLSDFVYSQVIKHQRRRRTTEVERRVVAGEATQYRERLCQAGLSGRINPAFVERLNLTIRQCISKLTRRTWGPARYTPELEEHLKWWRSYYHFVRPHERLAVVLSKPCARKGRQQPRKYRRRTPAMAVLSEKRAKRHVFELYITDKGGTKSCSSGEGGRRSKSDNLALFDQSITDAAAVATFSDMQGKT